MRKSTEPRGLRLIYYNKPDDSYNLFMTTIFRSGTDVEKDKDIYNTVIAVDLGFAQSSNESCGVAVSTNGKVGRLQCVSFGKCIDDVAEVVKSNKKVVLIIEAPLSGVFDEAKNPISRGELENKSSNSSINTSRYWYAGAGASICLGALFFLQMLRDQLQTTSDEDLEVVLYEGFVTFKEKPVNKKAKQLSHAEDAELLLQCFYHQHRRDIKNVELAEGNTTIVLSDIVTTQKFSKTPQIIIPTK